MTDQTRPDYLKQMIIRNISEAKAQLSKLIALVLKGEEVVISKAGQPVVKLVIHRGAVKSRQPGALKGAIVFKGDFEFSTEELTELFGDENDQRKQ